MHNPDTDIAMHLVTRKQLQIFFLKFWSKFSEHLEEMLVNDCKMLKCGNGCHNCDTSISDCFNTDGNFVCQCHGGYTEGEGGCIGKMTFILDM